MSKTWPLSLHEGFITTSSNNFLRMTCFLTLLCHLLLLSLLLVLLTIHLATHGKVRLCLGQILPNTIL
jgi:hypothetical protein